MKRDRLRKEKQRDEDIFVMNVFLFVLLIRARVIFRDFLFWFAVVIQGYFHREKKSMGAESKYKLVLFFISSLTDHLRSKLNMRSVDSLTDSSIGPFSTISFHLCTKLILCVTTRNWTCCDYSWLAQQPRPRRRRGLQLLSQPRQVEPEAHQQKIQLLMKLK